MPFIQDIKRYQARRKAILSVQLTIESARAAQRRLHGRNILGNYGVSIQHQAERHRDALPFLSPCSLFGTLLSCPGQKLQ